MTIESEDNTNSIRVRRAESKDHQAITRLAYELGYESAKEDVLRYLIHLFTSPDHEVFIAMDDSENVLGWIHVFISHRLMVSPFADLGGLVVSEPYRGRGIGYQLLLAAEQWATSKGLEKLRVRSNVKRKDAHKFYASRRYETIKSQVVFEKEML